MKEVFNKFIYEPWPWWLGGPLIGIFVVVLFLLERKQLGISSSFQYVCSKLSPISLEYFKDTSRSKWQFWFVIGLVVGGLALNLIVPTYDINIADETLISLSELGIRSQPGYVPIEVYSFSSYKNILILLMGGLMIGFGARYANGCTAGHAIMGCALMSPGSIIATVCFFVGGLIATYFILPIILI